MWMKTKTVLAAALILGSATAGFAQGVVPEVDGDGNPTGLYDVLPGTRGPQARSSIERSFAGPRHQAREPVYPSGANGPEWQRNFDNWLLQE
jgi:hypothetical protein